ncbi:MAG TPA: peptidoglycan-binding protein [Candidatus Paceibacterota bacterium]
MKKVAVSFLAVALFMPVAAFGFDKDCRNYVGECTLQDYLYYSAQTNLPTAERIAALQSALKLLIDQIALIKDPTLDPHREGPNCFVPTHDLYIGRTDAQTNGEVKKLQLRLKAEGYFPDAQGTGYYGEKTAAAVVKWQKAHSMGFVTTKSGVGPMTRAKMKCESTGAPVITKVEWRIEPANPSATDSYQKDEQAIFVDVIRSDNSIRGYSVGKAYGCAASSNLPAVPGKKVLGFVNCYYALSGVAFTAYEANGKFIVERGDESARDGSVIKTVVLEI